MPGNGVVHALRPEAVAPEVMDCGDLAVSLLFEGLSSGATSTECDLSCADSIREPPVDRRICVLVNVREENAQRTGGEWRIGGRRTGEQKGREQGSRKTENRRTREQEDAGQENMRTEDKRASRQGDRNAEDRRVQDRRVEDERKERKDRRAKDRGGARRAVLARKARTTGDPSPGASPTIWNGMPGNEPTCSEHSAVNAPQNTTTHSNLRHSPPRIVSGDDVLSRSSCPAQQSNSQVSGGAALYSSAAHTWRRVKVLNLDMAHGDAFLYKQRADRQMWRRVNVSATKTKMHMHEPLATQASDTRVALMLCK